MAVTDAKGRYIINGLIAGTYDLDVKGASLSYGDGSRTGIAVAANTVVPNINFALAPDIVEKGTIAGMVKSSAGQGLSGVEVSAWSWETGGWGNATTDGRGAYSLENLPAGGNYEVNFGWSTGGQYLYETQTGKSVAANTTTAINQTMETGLTITGRIVNDEAAGVGDVQVNAAASDGSHYGWASTDGNGYFTLPQMKSNKTYNLSFYVNPALGYLLPADIPASVATLEANKVMDIITLDSGFDLTGHLIDSSGIAVANVDVYIFSSTTQSWGHTRSNASGSFTLRGIASATDYTLNVYDKSNTYDAWQAEDVEVTADLIYPADIVLYKPSEKDGDFTGDGNYLKVSDVVATPGKTLTYNIGYKNNGVAAVSGASIKVLFPTGTDYVADSATLNSQPIAAFGGTSAVPGEIAPGGSGTLIYQVKVKADPTVSSIKNSGTMTVGGADTTLGAATTELAFSSINGPAVTKDGKMTVYGDCSAGATVIIEATKTGETTARRVGRATTSGRWWSQEIDLGITAATYNVTARV